MSELKEPLLISGKIVFEGGFTPISNDVVAIIRLENTSLADAPAQLIQQERIQVTPESARLGEIPFTLYGEIPDSRSVYTISAFIDIDGNGKISTGDYLSVESYPVLTYGNPNHVIIQVRKVI